MIRLGFAPIRWALARLIDSLPLPSQEEIDALIAESFPS